MLWLRSFLVSIDRDLGDTDSVSFTPLSSVLSWKGFHARVCCFLSACDWMGSVFDRQREPQQACPQCTPLTRIFNNSAILVVCYTECIPGTIVLPPALTSSAVARLRSWHCDALPGLGRGARNKVSVRDGVLWRGWGTGHRGTGCRERAHKYTALPFSSHTVPEP